MRQTDMTFELTVEGANVLVSSRINPGPNAALYFGGNAEDVSQSIATLQRAFPDSALFALHYRSYNGSTGEPSEAELVCDAFALFDRIHANYPHVVMIGRSLGSGSAFPSTPVDVGQVRILALRTADIGAYRAASSGI